MVVQNRTTATFPSCNSSPPHFPAKPMPDPVDASEHLIIFSPHSRTDNPSPNPLTIYYFDTVFPPTLAPIRVDQEHYIVGQLALHEQLGTGRTYTGYRTQVKYTAISPESGKNLSTANTNLVAKICYPPAARQQGGCPRLTAESTTREAWVLSNHLKGLQGTVVPRFYGLWRGYCKNTEGEAKDEAADEIFLMLLEDVGTCLYTTYGRAAEDALPFLKPMEV